MQFAQRHGGRGFRPVGGHAFQPVLHFQAHAQRHIVAVVTALQDGLHHAMHQRGQRHLRMLGHLDLQRRRAVRAQALGQSVGNRCGLGRFVALAFAIVRGVRVAEPLTQLFQRAQRLGLGLAQQPPMNHGLAVAVDGHDGTSCGLHVRAVSLQAFFQRLQLLAQGFAFLLQGIGLALVVGVHRGIHRFGHLLHFGLQLLDALRLTLVGFAPLPRCALEGVQVGMGHARRGIGPSPALGLHLGGDARQLVLRQPFQQGGVGQVHARIILCEQVTPNAAARLLVGVQPDEAHQRMPVRINLALGQALAQVRGVALPLRGVVVGGFLRRVVVRPGQGHQLVKAHCIGSVVRHQARRDICQLQATLHHQRRDAEIRCNVFNRSAFGHQRRKGFKLVCRVHGLALHVLGEAGRAGCAIGYLQTRHIPILGDAVFLCQQLQRGQPAAPGHHLVMLAIGGGNHDQVLQQAHALDARGQFGNGHARDGLAHVAARGAQHQPRQRNQNHVLARVGGLQHVGCGADGLGFGVVNGVHGESPIK
ncbi:hypothetical protein SDC9_107752 [bioreactor metagenome]|uniref:Uncharacterized protein n=1 Tax=bioreactor metagenome TaxID=1076179 RepID=A0A645B771_9ZZZZ